jgi:uncharacterized protein YjbJ (UPF0337 family)
VPQHLPNLKILPKAPFATGPFFLDGRHRFRVARWNLDPLRQVDRKTEQMTMDENRAEGTARNLGGKVQEGFGKVTGNARTQAEGIVNQAAGTAQNLYGQAADTARETASSLGDALRHNIETQPYTSALIALGIGWLLGRLHRPL